MTAAVLFLDGCALANHGAGGTAYTPETANARLQLPHVSTANDSAVAYQNPLIYEEYRATASQDNGHAEAVLLIARGAGTALALKPRRLASLTRLWRANRAPATIHWQGRQHALGPAPQRIRFRLFERDVPDQDNRACVAFIQLWHFQPDDPRRRPSRGLTGYHCAPPGQTLTAKTARQYLRSIQTRNTSGLIADVKQTNNPAALATARGNHQDSDYGLPDFPLGRVRVYPIGGANGGHD